MLMLSTDKSARKTLVLFWTLLFACKSPQRKHFLFARITLRTAHTSLDCRRSGSACSPDTKRLCKWPSSSDFCRCWCWALEKANIQTTTAHKRTHALKSSITSAGTAFVIGRCALAIICARVHLCATGVRHYWTETRAHGAGACRAGRGC